jgi:hypothetical protein
MDQPSSDHSHHPLLSSSMGSPNGGTSQETIRKMKKGIGGLLKLCREQHFTVVLQANAHPDVYVSCSPILKLPPLYHTTCLLFLIKSLTSCTSRDTNLSKTVQRTAVRAPTGHSCLRILPHTTPLASRSRCLALTPPRTYIHADCLLHPPTLSVKVSTNPGQQNL